MWHVPLAAERKLHTDASQQPSEDIDLQTRATFDCPASHSVSCFPPLLFVVLLFCGHPPDDWHDSWMLGFFPSSHLSPYRWATAVTLSILL